MHRSRFAPCVSRSARLAMGCFLALTLTSCGSYSLIRASSDAATAGEPKSAQRLVIDPSLLEPCKINTYVVPGEPGLCVDEDPSTWANCMSCPATKSVLVAERARLKECALKFMTLVRKVQPHLVALPKEE